MKIGWATTGSARTCSSFRSSGAVRHFNASAGDFGGTGGLGAGFLSSPAVATTRARLMPTTTIGMTTLLRMLPPTKRCWRDDVHLRLVDTRRPVNQVPSSSYLRRRDPALARGSRLNGREPLHSRVRV